MKSKQTLFTEKHLRGQFPTDEACLEWIKNHRWPDGILCITCRKITKHHKVTGRPVYECDRCGHQVSPLAGTIFHKSSTPLRVWFDAIHEMATTRTGYSAKALQRRTGVTYKTAWRMFKQIRTLLDENAGILTDEVEVDDTFIGGVRHCGKGGDRLENKSTVIGIAQRHGKIVTKVVADTSKYTVIPMINNHVFPKATIYTDEDSSLNTIKRFGYKHETVNHNAEEWVRGKVHTNTIEGFWSLVKRGIDGCYHAVSPKYLQSYLNEYQFRYNHRLESRPMFLAVLDQL